MVCCRFFVSYLYIGGGEEIHALEFDAWRFLQHSWTSARVWDAHISKLDGVLLINSGVPFRKRPGSWLFFFHFLSLYLISFFFLMRSGDCWRCSTCSFLVWPSEALRNSLIVQSCFCVRMSTTRLWNESLGLMLFC